MRFAQMFVLVLAVIAGTAAWAPGQESERQRERERTPEARGNSAAYQEGLRQGQEDARARRKSQYRNQRFKDEQARRDYEAGYNEGYRNATGANNGGRLEPQRYPGNGPYPGNVPYGGGPYGGNVRGNPGMSNARNIGRQDGLADGTNDRRNGHSDRPTQMDNYKNADRGYSSSFGDKNQYKQLYREGYMAAYQEGYNGRR